MRSYEHRMPTSRNYQIEQYQYQHRTSHHMISVISINIGPKDQWIRFALYYICLISFSRFLDHLYRGICFFFLQCTNKCVLSGSIAKYSQVEESKRKKHMCGFKRASFYSICSLIFYIFVWISSSNETPLTNLISTKGHESLLPILNPDFSFSTPMQWDALSEEGL